MSTRRQRIRPFHRSMATPILLIPSRKMISKKWLCGISTRRVSNTRQLRNQEILEKPRTKVSITDLPLTLGEPGWSKLVQVRNTPSLFSISRATPRDLNPGRTKARDTSRTLVSRMRRNIQGTLTGSSIWSREIQKTSLSLLGIPLRICLWMDITGLSRLRREMNWWEAIRDMKNKTQSSHQLPRI